MRKQRGVRVRVGVRVRFAFCSFGFSLQEYIHAASFSMWCERERVDAIFDLVPPDHWIGVRVRVKEIVIVIVRVRVRVRLGLGLGLGWWI